jgi:renalase
MLGFEQTKSMKTCIIIGAGMSGLSAALELKKNGWGVTILDKGRGVGGRMATRRMDAGRADHGAQYFSAKTLEFQQFIAELQANGIVREWDLGEGFSNPRFVGTDGMNAIAKYMAKDLTIKTNEKVVMLCGNRNDCEVVTEFGTSYNANRLIITAPVPQVTTIFEDSQIELTEAEKAELSLIEYAPCIAVMLLLNQKSNIPKIGFLKFDTGPVAWVADNFQKGISPLTYTVTIHASAQFSQQRLEADQTETGKMMIDSLKQWIDPNSIESTSVHRWRYSLAEKRHSEPFIVCGQPSFPVLIGGDGFGMGNVEGAFVSGLQMARELMAC